MADLTTQESSRVNRRQLVKTGTLSAAVLLMAALLLIVNYFGFKYYKRFDWTRSHLYSLSPKTQGILGKLTKDVDAVVFLAPQDELYAPLRETLSRYAALSPHVHVRVVDAEKKPVEAQQLVDKYNVKNAGLVLATDKDKRVLDTAELADFDFSGVQFGQKPQMTGFKGEQVITSALLQLSEGRKPKVLFTTGHGELSLDDRGARGLAGAQEVLGRDNFDLSEWASLGQAAVPAGTDLVVIAGPKGSFVQPELDAFAVYLKGGGRLLVLLDPVLGPNPGSGLVSTGLEKWLTAYGVKVDADIVVDPSNPLPFFGPETIFVNKYGDHPITKPLSQGGLPSLVSLVRSVGKMDAPGYTVTTLLETTPGGWGETDLAHLEKVSKDASDLPGPVSLAVAVQQGAPAKPADPDSPLPAPKPAANPKGPRLVVVGDSDFADSQLLQANTGNSVLLANIVNWLVEREDLLAIPPKKPEQVHLALTQSEMRGVYLLSLLALPGLAVILGGLVYAKRRR
ncbi:MAG TPA: GldG family protein [Thermoanaerobaculia bacterium]|nr:GldG family protein [Thermoanaerobaculia bacterium]